MLKRLVLAALALACLVVPAQAQTCRASHYGSGERLNTHTANGERFNPSALTAAHRTLPFGTKLRVSWQGRSVTVRITDRGPARWTRRCIDLSTGAARSLGMIRAGVAAVQIEVLK
jgi:rare lipoprotein A